MSTDMKKEQKNHSRKRFMILFRRLCKNKFAVAGMIVIFFVIVIAIIGPYIAPYDYAEINVLEKFTKPNADHIMGTDEYGRDIFSRLLVGTRMSLLIGVVGVAVCMILGIIVGCMAGYYGGWVDNIIMRILDIIQSIPSILLAIVVSAVLGTGMVNCIIALAVANVPSVARLTRASILNVRGMEYIEATRAINCTDFRIITKHVLPNVISPLIVNATMSIANMILVAASLSFIGLGVQPPMAEWGAMISGARNFSRSYPYMVLFPGFAIFILVLSFNMLGDGLRDVLDPKLKN